MPIYKPIQINQSTEAFNFLPSQLKKLQSGWIIEYYCELRPHSGIAGQIHVSKKGRPAPGHHQGLFFTRENICRVRQKKKGIVSVGHFSRLEAVRFMDTVSSNGISARTFNNKLKLMRILWGWMVEHGYTSENVFDSIKTKRMEEKRRILIDKPTRSRIAEYFSANVPPMVMVCELVYSALLRPKEIRNLLVSDIDFNECSITVRSDNAKNHHQRIVPISERLSMKIKSHVQQHPKQNYVFGPMLIPGSSPCGASYVIKTWERMKQKLKLDNSVQLYGLRDTGISEK